MSQGADEIKKLQDAGFTQEEIGAWTAERKGVLSDAGFSSEEVDAYFGRQPFNPEPVKKLINENMQALAPKEGEGAGRPREVSGFLDALEAGFQMSVTGLTARGAVPDAQLGEESGFLERLGYNTAMVVGDLPYMVGGAVLGGAGGIASGPGAVATAAGGAFALPQGLRTVLMDAYSGNQVDSVGDFFNLLSTSVNATIKGWVTGAATAGAGAIAKTAVPAVAPAAIKAATPAAAEIATMVGIGSALEGHVPRAQDFLDAAVLVGGMKAAGHVAGRLRQNYAETGEHPVAAVERAKSDPAYKQDLIIPRPAAPKPAAPPAVETMPLSEAQAKVLSRIGSEPTKSKLPGLRDLYTAAVDDLHPLNHLENQLAGKVPVAESPYKLARMSRASYGMADSFIKYGTFDYNTRATTGKPLAQVLEPVKNDLDGFRAYAMSARALELQGRGITTGIDPVAATEVVTAGKGRFEQTFRELQDYQTSVLKYYKDSGMLSDAQFGAMLEANKNYVSFARFMDEGNAGGIQLGSGVKGVVKKIEGSERLIVDPIESTIKNTYALVAMAERNGVGRALDNLVKMNPERAAELGVMRKESVKAPPSPEVAAFIKDNGLPEAAAEVVQSFRNTSVEMAKGDIAFFENGNRVVMQVPAGVAEALQGLRQSEVSMVTKIAAIPAKTLRAGITLSPEFVVRNLIRDQASVGILSAANGIPFLGMLRGAGSLLKKDQHFQDWIRSGGANAAMVSLDRKYIQNNIFKLSKENSLFNSAWNVAKSPLEYLRVASELVENATRLGEFKQVRKKGGDLRTAAFASREVTLDFQRVGAKARAFNMVTAFANPAIQGLDRVARAFKDDPLGATAKTAAYITLPSLALLAVNMRDPRWKEIPDWQKDTFWIVFTDDHTFRIPKPFELGLLFGTLPERAMEAFLTENPDAFDNFEESVLNAVTPPWQPTALQPFIETFANKSTFTGSPIVPAALEGLLPEYQYTEYTSETAKLVGSAIAAVPGLKTSKAASPLVLENFWRSWTGGMGQYLLQAVDKSLVASGAVPDPVKPDDTLADMPVAKAFTVRHPSAGMQPIQDFYDKYNERRQVYDTVMRLAKEGDEAAAAKEYKLAPGAMANLSSARRTLGDLAKMTRMIYKDKSIPPAEKRQLIDSTYMQMSDIAKAGVELINEIDKSLK